MKTLISKSLFFFFACAVVVYCQPSSACSKALIDKLASHIEGDEASSAGQMRVAVAGARTCAGDSAMLAYAARAYAAHLNGEWAYSVQSSVELAKLCDQDAVCGVTLVKAIGSAIEGSWAYSIGMSRAIKDVVVRNPFKSVQCAAIESIINAENPSWENYSGPMSDITVEISELQVDPAR